MEGGILLRESEEEYLIRIYGKKSVWIWIDFEIVIMCEWRRRRRRSQNFFKNNESVQIKQRKKEEKKISILLAWNSKLKKSRKVKSKRKSFKKIILFNFTYYYYSTFPSPSLSFHHSKLGEQFPNQKSDKTPRPPKSADSWWKWRER